MKFEDIQKKIPGEWEEYGEYCFDLWLNEEQTQRLECHHLKLIVEELRYVCFEPMHVVSRNLNIKECILIYKREMKMKNFK